MKRKIIAAAALILVSFGFVWQAFPALNCRSECEQDYGGCVAFARNSHPRHTPQTIPGIIDELICKTKFQVCVLSCP